MNMQDCFENVGFLEDLFNSTKNPTDELQPKFLRKHANLEQSRTLVSRFHL